MLCQVAPSQGGEHDRKALNFPSLPTFSLVSGIIPPHSLFPSVYCAGFSPSKWEVCVTNHTIDITLKLSSHPLQTFFTHAHTISVDFSSQYTPFAFSVIPYIFVHFFTFLFVHSSSSGCGPHETYNFCCLYFRIFGFILLSSLAILLIQDSVVSHIFSLISTSISTFCDTSQFSTRSSVLLCLSLISSLFSKYLSSLTRLLLYF